MPDDDEKVSEGVETELVDLTAVSLQDLPGIIKANPALAAMQERVQRKLNKGGILFSGYNGSPATVNGEVVV